MKEIPLTQGQVALVDDADYDWLMQWKWQVRNSRGRLYACRGEYFPELGRSLQFQMHREILQVPSGVKVDHEDRNSLNNQRYNLRKATTAQNGANRGKEKGATSSRFKGVSWAPNCNKWRSRITVNYKWIDVGYFCSEEEAARAYDDAAKRYWGAFACPNFPETPALANQAS